MEEEGIMLTKEHNGQIKEKRKKMIWIEHSKANFRIFTRLTIFLHDFLDYKDSSVVAFWIPV